MRLRQLISLDIPSRSDLVIFGGYCLASAVYIAVGVAWLDFLLSFFVGAGYLLVAAWAVPAVVRRFL